MIGFEQRLIICGALEAATIVDAQNVAGIITVSRKPIECEIDKFEHHRIRHFLEQIEARNIPHYYSQLFHASSDSFILGGPPERIVNEAEEILRFSHACLENTEPSQKLIIHCTHGKDRSAFADLYLLREETSSLAEALAALRRIRPTAALRQLLPEYFYACFEGGWEELITQFQTTIPKPVKPISERDRQLLENAFSKALEDLSETIPRPKSNLRRGIDFFCRKR